MAHLRTCFAAVLLCLVGSAATSWAQNEGCITEKCHATMGTKKWVHGPVGVGACTICHTRVKGKDHEFTFTLEKEELCFACHDESRDMMLQDHRHTPVKEGRCTSCHNPHQSDFRFQLIAGTTEKLCLSCHDAALFHDENVHGPVEEGDCNACHNPHASAFPKQLRQPLPDLCFGCHEDLGDIPGSAHQHSPVAESCLKCHSPHASKEEYMLQTSPPGLCFGCHENIAAYANVSTQHPPVQNGDCVECHNVHGSDQPRLMLKPLTEVCFKCHSEFGEYVKAQPYAHGPLRDNDCNACHDPHGSDHYRILRKDFPKEFYVPYAPENYDLCFECHNREIALEPETKTLTDFRNGVRNLHYVHVNKQEKGRSCRACHQVHASSQEKHIRVSVPYGKMDWELPVHYTKTNNGGRCEVGCHSPKEYTRQ